MFVKMPPVTVFILSAFVVLNIVSGEKVVTCYYGSWATYRPALGRFDVSDINTDLCTHVIYAFTGITEQGAVVSLDPYLDLPDNYGRDNFRKFTDLKNKNPKLKTLLAVGGWNEGSYKYSVMAASPRLRQTFINSSLSMLTQFNFDGLDIDWEYPNRRDSAYGVADVNNFSILLKEMREVYDKHGYMLTATVSAVRDSAVLSYDIPTISKYLDYIHIMAYDMHGAWDSTTGHNAGLHKSKEDEGADRRSLYTVDVALEYWLEEGCPPEKIVLGVPLYGRTFTLTDARNNSVKAPANGPGIAGPYTATNGFIGYNEFCKKIQNESWTVKLDAEAKVPYAFRNTDWVSYDDPDSIRRKAEYGMQYNLAGIMLWSIETDDFHNVCGGGNFPMLRAIHEVLYNNNNGTEETANTTVISTTSINNETSTDVTTTAPNVSTPGSSTVVSNSTATTETSICKGNRYESDPTDCTCFYICVTDVYGNFKPVKFKCPGSLYWDNKLCVCNYPNLTECTTQYKITD